MTIKVALLGCGLMMREHCSYIKGFKDRYDIKLIAICDNDDNSIIRIKNLLDPSEIQDLIITKSEDELLSYAHMIDLLVIATPNYMHTPSLLKWCK